MQWMVAIVSVGYGLGRLKFKILSYNCSLEEMQRSWKFKRVAALCLLALAKKLFAPFRLVYKKVGAMPIKHHHFLKLVIIV